MTDKGLGRRYQPDQRDTIYPIRALVPDEPARTFRNWWPNGAWLDQGRTGTCVGHAWAHYVEDGPLTHPGTIDAIALYGEAVLHDPWPENDGPDLQFGTTIRAGAQALQARGLVESYLWAWDAETVIRALLDVGPVVMGTWWTSDMSNPDAQGVVRYTGHKLGGHAYLLNGVNRNRGMVRAKNSWGRGWARNGYFYIPFEDLERLIAEDGEACLAVEKRP